MRKKIINLLKKLMTTSVIIITFVVFLQVLCRHLPFLPPSIWTVEISRFLLIWLVFLGAAVGVGEKDHFSIDIFEDIKENYPKVRYYQLLITNIIIFLFGVVILLFSWQFALSVLNRKALTLPISLFWVNISYFVSGIFMSYFQLNILRNINEIDQGGDLYC